MPINYPEFNQWKPRKGDPVAYYGKIHGHVRRTEGNLCWIDYLDGSLDPMPFIWCFKDGLNAIHDWPTKRNGPVARCPGNTPERYNFPQ